MEREEAINLIKQVLPCLNIDEKIREGFETLIPELAENEDERIIRTFQEYVKNRNWPLNGATQAEALAYLERQKECVNLSYSDIETIKTALRVSGLEFSANREAYEKLEGQKKQKDNKFAPRVLPCSAAWFEDGGENQKEQKSEEKLSKEEYVKKFKALCDAYEIKLPNREYDIYGLCEDLHKLFGDIQKPAEQNKATINGEPIPTENQSVNIALSKEEKERIRQNGRLDVCYDPEKYGLCHKTEEWSEGEMKVLDSIIDDYEKAAKSFCGYDGKITLLKAIRDGEYVLPKQEWSEEDEQTFINSVETLEYLGKFELANWLKDHKNQFLKPQNTWKPSNWRISRGNGKKR